MRKTKNKIESWQESRRLKLDTLLYIRARKKQEKRQKLRGQRNDCAAHEKDIAGKDINPRQEHDQSDP